MLSSKVFIFIKKGRMIYGTDTGTRGFALQQEIAAAYEIS
jgi:hypothetical protein